jgi:hypothetical protein
VTPAEAAAHARATAAGLDVLHVETQGGMVVVTVREAPSDASSLSKLAGRLGVAGMTVSTMGDVAGNVVLWLRAQDFTPDAAGG